MALLASTIILLQRARFASRRRLPAARYVESQLAIAAVSVTLPDWLRQEVPAKRGRARS